MSDSTVLLNSDFPDLIHRGKVRDTHFVDTETLLMVSTDRVSAFDVVLPSGIPGKGKVLNQMASFWFHKTEHIIPNHFLKLGIHEEKLNSFSDDLKKRSMLVKKAERFDVECVARGYITGSALLGYKEKGSTSGIVLPEGLIESDKLKSPIFTPSTKANEGHDENISFDQMITIVGSDVAEKLRQITLDLYSYAHDYALGKGIIIADTKFEFGMIDGDIILIDEILTPDSSRFWDYSRYNPGQVQDSFDKQFIRNWLLAHNWDKEPPGPKLPSEIISETSRIYEKVFETLTESKIK